MRWGNSDDSKMVDFARLLLATELTGAKAYWHMTPSQNGEDTRDGVPMAYTNDFRKNFMVGNLGMTDVACTTWFGTDDLYVHLINFLPVTPITAELFDKGKPYPSLRTNDTSYMFLFLRSPALHVPNRICPG